MSKKSSNWVTITEETLHTPVSQAPARAQKTDETVQHKAAWGVGFVVMVVAAFAILAPQEFANILQGNLFETSDLAQEPTSQDITPLAVLPAKTAEEKAMEEAALSESTTEAPVSTSTPTQVVQPEGEAVSVQVEPIVTAETVTIDPIVTDEPAVTDEPIATETPEAPVQESANERLLRELAEQVQAIQSRDDQSQQVVQDIATQVQQQIDDLRGSAIPPMVQTIVSTPQSATGYRQNPYKVTITPQQALANNHTLQAQVVASGATASQITQAQQPLTDQLGRATATPESGPKEALMLALALAFLAGLSWKAKSTFAA